MIRGLTPEQIKKRDQDIKEDFKSGMSIIRMVHKYQITSSRIYQILGLNKK